jgi:hypothetical protein
MANPPSAAQSLYPHLKSGTPDVVQQRRQGSVADAMFPSLAPKPKPAPHRHRESTEEVSLAQRCDENPMLELMLAKSGLVRKR